MSDMAIRNNFGANAYNGAAASRSNEDNSGQQAASEAAASSSVSGVCPAHESGAAGGLDAGQTVQGVQEAGPAATGPSVGQIDAANRPEMQSVTAQNLPAAFNMQ